VAQKNIPVDTETYEVLKSLKRPNESFRELIVRLIEGQRDRILRHFGSWELNDDELEEINTALEKGWAGWSK
jgi:predicted CopG family antitoxin